MLDGLLELLLRLDDVRSTLLGEVLDVLRLVVLLHDLAGLALSSRVETKAYITSLQLVFFTRYGTFRTRFFQQTATAFSSNVGYFVGRKIRCSVGIFF